MTRGEELSFTHVIGNEGTTDSANFVVSYFVELANSSNDPIFIGNSTTLSIPTGGTVELISSLTIPLEVAAGGYEFIWDIDGDNRIPETDESNNRFNLADDVFINNPVIFEISDLQESIPFTRTSHSFEVTTNGIWEWRKTGGEWLTIVDQPSPQNGSGSFNYIVEANPFGTPRVGQFIFTAADGSEYIHIVNQAGRTNLPNLVDGDSPSVAPPPNQLVVGRTFQISRLIRNTGVRDSGPFFIEWGFRPFNSAPGTETLLKRSVVQNIRTGQSKIALDDVTIPIDIPPGSYVITWFIDSAEEIIELDETDNKGQFAGLRTLVAADELMLPTSSRSFTEAGISDRFFVNSNISWSWSSNRDWITAPGEARTQTATQTFDFQIAPNNTANSRSGEITFTGGGLTATFRVSQAGSTPPPSGPPIISMPKFSPSSREYSFIFETVPGVTYIVESSSNLDNWDEEERFSNSSGPKVFVTEVMTTANAQRYYRIRTN